MLNELFIVQRKQEELTASGTVVLPRLAINNVLLDAIAALKRAKFPIGQYPQRMFYRSRHGADGFQSP